MKNTARHLSSLIDVDPSRAIAEARKLDALPQSNGIKASVFIDAGAAVKDADVIAEGVAIVRDLLCSDPDNRHLKYNLANGLHALALTAKHSMENWHLSTRNLRHEARALLSTVASDKDCPRDLASRAYTNAGNLLFASYRWVEAYDAYLAALEKERGNGVASSNVVRLLDHCIRLGIGDSRVLAKVARKYAMIAAESREQTRRLAGVKAQDVADREIAGYLALHGSAEAIERLNAYQQFVLSNRLQLSMTAEILGLSRPRFDPLSIRSITEDIDAGSTPPPVFAMFNVLKSDYLAARWLAFKALRGNGPPESGSYADTLDYACYGTKYSLITFAQKAAWDVLDKMAVATAAYLGLENPEHTTFARVWYRSGNKKKPSPQDWELTDDMKAEIDRGNVALIALSDVADDLLAAGYLGRKKGLRHASTHRFVVLHDEAVGPQRASDCIQHYHIEDFDREVIETLQLTRAALIYFVEMVSRREHRIGKGPVLPMLVPSHHYIRGRD